MSIIFCLRDFPWRPPKKTIHVCREWISIAYLNHIIQYTACLLDIHRMIIHNAPLAAVRFIDIYSPLSLFSWSLFCGAISVFFVVTIYFHWGWNCFIHLNRASFHCYTNISFSISRSLTPLESFLGHMPNYLSYHTKKVIRHIYQTLHFCWGKRGKYWHFPKVDTEI